MKTLKDELKVRTIANEKLISDFDNERQVLKNMVTVTEDIMEDQKTGLNTIITEHVKVSEDLKEEIKALKESLENEKEKCIILLKEKDSGFEYSLKQLNDERNAREMLAASIKKLKEELVTVKDEIKVKNIEIEKLIVEKKECAQKLVGK